jgi:hypothetical protein
MYNLQEFRKACPFIQSPKKLFRLAGFRWRVPKVGSENLRAVVQGSGDDVRWSPKVGVTLKVADWHVPSAQPSVPRGSQEGVLSRGCHVWFAKFVWTRFSLT